MRFTLLVITICLFASGCNSDPRCRRETALLRAEILDLEDKYYLLKSERDSAMDQLSAFHGSGEIVSEPYYENGSYISEGDVINGGMISQGEIIYDGAPIVNEGYNNQLNSPSGAPNVQVPSDQIHSQEPASAEGAGSGNNSSIGPQEFEDFETDEFPGLTLNSPDQSVSHQRKLRNEISEVLINPDATRGRDIDGQPGDEGLDMLIQTRSPDGKIELQSGDLTVSIVDPKQPAGKQKIGQWKFIDKEAELFFANDELGSYGILLHLPWEQATPVNPRLIAQVRFVTTDGKTLETSSAIRINPPGSNYSPDDPLVAGWTQRDPRWSRGFEPQYDRQQNSRTSNQSRERSNDSRQSSIAKKSGPTRKLTPARPVSSVKVQGWRPVR